MSSFEESKEEIIDIFRLDNSNVIGEVSQYKLNTDSRSKFEASFDSQKNLSDLSLTLGSIALSSGLGASLGSYFIDERSNLFSGLKNFRMAADRSSEAVYARLTELEAMSRRVQIDAYPSLRDSIGMNNYREFVIQAAAEAHGINRVSYPPEFVQIYDGLKQSFYSSQPEASKEALKIYAANYGKEDLLSDKQPLFKLNSLPRGNNADDLAGSFVEKIARNGDITLSEIRSSFSQYEISGNKFEIKQRSALNEFVTRAMRQPGLAGGLAAGGFVGAFVASPLISNIYKQVFSNT